MGPLPHRIERWRQALPLTLQALIITGAAGILFWFLQDAFYSNRLQEFFQEHILEELRRDVLADRLQFDARLRLQEQTTRLLVERQAFVRHVGLQEEIWSGEPSEPLRHTEIPAWLPERAVMPEVLQHGHLFLVDGRGRVRESLPDGDKPFPVAMVERFADACLSRGPTGSTVFRAGIPDFLTCAILPGSQDAARALLVVVTPLDDQFLQSFRFSSEFYEPRVLLDASATRIVSSSRPDLVGAGLSLDALQSDYFMLTGALAEENPADRSAVRFAGLIPKAQLAAITTALIREGSRQRAIGHLLMIAVFVGIIYWLGRGMESLTRRMLTFARDRLHLALSPAAPGDALQQVIRQFDILTIEIEETRAREARSSAQLAQSNQALENSLTMLKRTHVQLLESEKMAALGGLVAGVAHEINTPVGIGVTAASFLDSRTRECQTRYAEGTLDRTELDGYFRDARDSSGMILANLMRAAELVRSFKQVAVDTSSEASRRFDFVTVIQQILQSLHPRLKKTRHKVRVDCPEGLSHFGRPDVFSQIITNFVLNSLQHGLRDDQDGTMRIQVRAQGEEIVLHYTDDGRGMDEEALARIFEPFFTTARHKGGSGLGMHIVFNLVTGTLGGRIRCDSAPGQGAAFIITFPARHERQPRESNPPLEQRPWP
ncbi:MAG: HAMP domain-containing histidine kinase [Magnetococcales bacterium]|nr:HAMP domain-containing histidine kinase [Magnetococcales bacterium]